MEKLRVTPKAYTLTLDYLGYAWETGKGTTCHSWHPDNAIGLHAEAIEYAYDCAIRE